MQPKNVLYVLAEKVVATYVQAFISLLMLGPTINTSIAQSAAIAAIPAALTFLVNNLPALPAKLPFWLDLVGRATRTYAVSFLGFLLAVPVFQLKFSIFTAAAAAALPGALAVIKAGIASKIGSGTAALLPASLDIGPAPSAELEAAPVAVGAHVAKPGEVIDNQKVIDQVFPPGVAAVPNPPVAEPVVPPVVPGPPPAPPTES